MVYISPNSGESRPYPYLVRYDHQTASVIIDLLAGPALDEDDRVTRHVRRMTDSYLFLTWESARGDIVAAHFALSEDFFDLPGPPSSVKADMKWLSLEMRQASLADVSPWWIALVGYGLLSASEDEGKEDD